MGWGSTTYLGRGKAEHGQPGASHEPRHSLVPSRRSPGTRGEAGGELVISRDGVSARAAGGDGAGAHHPHPHLLPGLRVLPAEERLCQKASPFGAPHHHLPIWRYIPPPASPSGAHLGLIADNHVVLGGERHVAHVKLHPAAFQHAGKARPRPQSRVVRWGLTLHHRALMRGGVVRWDPKNCLPTWGPCEEPPSALLCLMFPARDTFVPYLMQPSILSLVGVMVQVDAVETGLHLAALSSHHVATALALPRLHGAPGTPAAPSAPMPAGMPLAPCVPVETHRLSRAPPTSQSQGRQPGRSWLSPQCSGCRGQGCQGASGCDATIPSTVHGP